MPGTYPQTWFPVLIQIVIAMAVAGAMIGLSAILGRRLRDPVKSSPYESGMLPVGTARERFSVKFYLVGMVFILFDIEAIFLYPWAGFFYIWKKGVLNWAADESRRPRQTESKRAA
jgi:NADH-quinone oxidoreductase subunit A